MKPRIVVSAVAIVRDGAVLTVRKEGTERFMLVGGKPEEGESAHDAAVRETKEETGLVVGPLELLGEFVSETANEPGHELHSTVYLGEADGEPSVAAEIAELRWTDLDGDYADLAPMLEFNVLPLLRARFSEPSPQDRPLLYFGLTPPRATTDLEASQRVADVTLARLEGLDLDGLILYDIDDESERNAEERPFPFVRTQDPAEFLSRHLGAWQGRTVVYRSVGKYESGALEQWLGQVDCDRVSTVFVGAASSSTPVATTLAAAQALHSSVRPELPLGAVAIPERHSNGGTEHLKMLRKQSRGVSYFVTQVVYDANAAKSLVSDYFFACREQGLTPAPVVFTLSVCGSAKTLEFLKWLGVDVPRWLVNDILHSADPLALSYQRCLHIADDLADYCRRIGIPFGFNVESVSIRKAEIEASVRLAHEVAKV